MTSFKGLVVGISDTRDNSNAHHYLNKYHEVLKQGGTPLLLPPVSNENQLTPYLKQCSPHILWIGNKPKEMQSPLKKQWDNCTFFFSSGSTNTPKVIVHKNSSLEASALESLQAIGQINQDKYEALLTPLPMWHVGGILNYYRCQHLNISYENICVQRKDFLSHLDTKKKTLAVMVPAQLAKILEHKTTQSFDHLTFYLGGAAISAKLVEQIKTNKLNAYGSYGMTETAGAIANAKVHKIPSMKIMEKVLVKIDEEKRLFVSSKRLALGTIENNEFKKLELRQGYFETSDSCSLNNNEITIHGRLDLIFLSGGENINPMIIENEVMAICPHLNQVKVIPVKDDLLENKIALFIDHYSDEDVKQINEKLSQTMRPHGIYPWPSFSGIKPSLKDFQNELLGKLGEQ